MRRTAYSSDKPTLLRGLAEGVASLQNHIETLPFVTLAESHLVTAERALVAMQGLLIALRQHVAGAHERQSQT